MLSAVESNDDSGSRRHRWEACDIVNPLRHPASLFFFFFFLQQIAFPVRVRPSPLFFPGWEKCRTWKLRPSHRAIGHICSTLKREAASSKRVKSVGWLVPRPVVPHILFFFFSLRSKLCMCREMEGHTSASSQYVYLSTHFDSSPPSSKAE